MILRQCYDEPKSRLAAVEAAYQQQLECIRVCIQHYTRQLRSVLERGILGPGADEGDSYGVEQSA